MIIILIVMTILAVAIFAMISGDNRKRKRQNPAPYVSPEGQKKSRAPGLD
jgi:flagellar basal body-associated protein FliL